LSYALFEGRPLTTRGRWINPLVFAHFSLEKRLPQLKAVKAPIFILGTGRSGTTILGIVLSMHREVGFLNEPKALWHALRDDEDLIGSYTHIPARYRLDAEDASPAIISAAHRLYGAYLRTTFNDRVVDKYPELIFRVPFVKKIFPDARFLFLVRNGWDTCHSIDAWSARSGLRLRTEVHDWWGVNRRKWHLLVEQLVGEYADLAPHLEDMCGWTNHADMAAVEWIVTMREGLRLLREYPNDVLRVTYEDICQSPRLVMGGVCEFANLSWDEVFMRYAVHTLRPAMPKNPFPLAAAIEVPFRDTMNALGYNG
ncbi:sulfotransferase family protein, partial [Candidatus Nomurabacteria bacterium CG2_30_43_9]